jgi:excisionase family DNA binding protein
MITPLRLENERPDGSSHASDAAGVVISGVSTMAATPTVEPSRQLGDVKAVGKVLALSWRTVYRLADAGKIPAGFKLGSSRRWDLSEIEAFIASGCKPPKALAKGVR